MGAGGVGRRGRGREGGRHGVALVSLWIERSGAQTLVCITVLCIWAERSLLS